HNHEPSIQQPPLQAATAGPGRTEPNVTPGPARSQPPPGQRAAMKNAATWPRNVTNKGIVLGSSNYRTPSMRGVSTASSPCTCDTEPPVLLGRAPGWFTGRGGEEHRSTGQGLGVRQALPSPEQ